MVSPPAIKPEIAHAVWDGVLWAGADWDPLGKDLAVIHGEPGGLEFPIGKVLVKGVAESSLRFSPDGRQIAFWKSERGGWALSVVDRRGQAVKTISSGWPSASGIPGWRADGQELWFRSSRAGGLGSNDIYRATSNGSSFANAVAVAALNTGGASDP